MSLKRSLKLMADYGCQPLWENGAARYNVDPADLPITPDLRDALHAWQQRCDDTLDMETGYNSGFHTSESAAAFNADGERLLRRLQAELGNRFEIVFEPVSWEPLR